VIRAKMLSGSYPTQAWFSKFDTTNGQSCPLCSLEPKTIPHLLLSCPGTEIIRQPILDILKQSIIAHKITWKAYIKAAFFGYWFSSMLQTSTKKSTLTFLDRRTLVPGKPHPVCAI
jgi:hypothetical protein